jgi:inosose dehydratase
MKLIVGAQVYPWIQFYSERGESYSDHYPEIFSALAGAGIGAWEESNVSQELEAALERHGLSMPSMYAAARLHEDDWEAGVASIVASAKRGLSLRAKFVVVNPDPIDWSGKTAKTDAQLRTQATAMGVLNDELARQGQVLAYHVHSPEMLHSAREFHHMMLAVNTMGMCLDTHWIYRGAGNSQVALEDIVTMYASRVVSLHIRQSRDGVWTEFMDAGDIDYEPIAGTLRERGFSGPIVLECAFEEGTPRKLSMEESHAASRHWVERVFGLAEGD